MKNYSINPDPLLIIVQEIQYDESCNNIHVYNSLNITDIFTRENFIKDVVILKPNFNKRSINSYLREWKAHNILYHIGIAKERTKELDLNYDEPWHRRLGYWFIATFFREKRTFKQC